MCGISLIVNKNKCQVEKNVIEKMNNLVAHRGPDDEGFFFEMGIAMGHRRLSILDTSQAGHQPMSVDGCTIIHNGEIYNYIELRTELEEDGISFVSSSDTEVILAAYSKWGESCVTRFNGMWAFVIFDRKNNKIFCSRDRFGIKPFVYRDDVECFYIASEAKQIVKTLDNTVSVNLNSAMRFLAKGELNINSETMFEGVFELPAGSNLIYDINSNKFVINEWYSIDTIMMEDKMSFAVASGKVYDLFIDSLRLRMRSDVVVGSCLSGGIDSSSIVCGVMNVFHEKEVLTTVSSCYSDPKYDEQEYIDEVIRTTGCSSVKIFPDLNELNQGDLLEKISYHQDQPIPSCSHFSEYKVFEAAKDNGLIVMLDGQGADEYLAGYGEFYIVALKKLLFSFRFIRLFSEIQCKANLKNISIFSEFILLVRGVIYNTIVPAVKTMMRKCDGNSFFTNKGEGLLQNQRSFNNTKDILSLSKHELNTSSLPYQLHSEDRNSMMHSVESRLPFLDYRLVEFVLKLPDEFKYSHGITKKVIREAMRGVLPQKVHSRKDKMGFVAPDEEWLKSNPNKMRIVIAEAVNKTKGLVEAEKVIEIYEDFIAGKREYHPIIFRVIAFSAWMKAFNVEDIS